MVKLNIGFIFILFIALISVIKAESDSIDLSDDNPVVYCLKSVFQYSTDDVKEYLLLMQVKEYAETHQIKSKEFSSCIDNQVYKEDDDE